MSAFDITFVGHMAFDDVEPFNGPVYLKPGSAVLCGAMAAVRAGARTAVVTRMSVEDAWTLDPMQAAGVEILLLPAPQTTYIKVIHPTADVDVRTLTQMHSAGFFHAGEFPSIKTRWIHLAGISDQEFDLAFIHFLLSQDSKLSADMQSFVRQVDAKGRIQFRDVPSKLEIIPLLDAVKLDVVEAEILTGTRDLEQAAKMVESWGCPEVVVTQADGVLARVNGRTYYENFTNRSVVGRTGRGDTTFGGYLAWRLEHAPEEALKFAAALVSIKMETPGPFQGTLEDVLLRMQKG
jgi:sugar/nucleoside kinase (ribokinase family)